MWNLVGRPPFSWDNCDELGDTYLGQPKCVKLREGVSGGSVGEVWQAGELTAEWAGAQPQCVHLPPDGGVKLVTADGEHTRSTQRGSTQRGSTQRSLVYNSEEPVGEPYPLPRGPCTHISERAGIRAPLHSRPSPLS